MRYIITAVFLAIFVIKSPTMSAQNEIHGFRLIEKRFVKEVNSECLYYEHVKTGARLLKVMSDDDNKTFAITFMTLPESDNGIAHIMEHSVLNGSKRFPVKSPFDVLSKGSLNTFMNAFTSRDATTYPFASRNNQDYFNMMQVYLDAVFNPLLYSDTRILKQEGWHYELASKDEPVIYKGVVYNEMKGAFSNPQREHLYLILKSLFPDNVYGFESGGLPASIPSLTQETFVNFHKKFYHPSNAYIFLYGNGDLNKELELINNEYLSHYSRMTEKISVTDQKPFQKLKILHEYYPVLEGAATDKQTYFSYNFVMGYNSDYTKSAALNLLCEVLVNQESAPVRLALQKAGIGQDVMATVLDYKQNGIAIIVQNANAGDRAECRRVILASLEEVVANGIDKNDLKGVLNRYEFELREGSNAQKGIALRSRIQPAWFFEGDPFKGLGYESVLKTLKEGAEGRYFETLIEKGMLKNSHASFITFEPSPGFDKIRNQKVEEELVAYKKSLSDAQQDALIKETQELIAFQNSSDSPEALATIPMLSLKDIDRKTEYFQCKSEKAGKNTLLYYETETSGVMYPSLMFDMRVLPQELIPYAALLSNIATSLNTKNYTYARFNQEMNLNTGGFSTSVTSFQSLTNAAELQPFFVVSGKVMNDKAGSFFSLSQEIISNLKCNDPERLKELITRDQAQLEAGFNREGFAVAMRRIQSYISPQGVFNEMIQGIDYFRFVTDMSVSFDTRSAEIAEKLEQTAKLLFTAENMTITLTCNPDGRKVFLKELNGFISTVPAGRAKEQVWKFEPENLKEAILTASKVQYVMTGYNLTQLGQEWNGKLLVLNQILSTDFLYNQIRVIGGAYGGFSRLSQDGTMIFGSYRDPNLKNTLEVYEKAGDYVASFEADESSMTRYIIGTIAGMDGPMTAQQKGSAAFKNYLTGRTLVMQQKERDDVLATRPEDIRKFGKVIKEMAARSVICVYGNTEKIQAEKQRFNTLMKIRNDG